MNFNQSHHEILSGIDPNLFFVKGDGFKVFALADEGRPTPKTQLYQAPYFNVWADHKVCLGGSKMPKANHPSLTRECERGFFQSAFTHSNIEGTNLTAHKDGHLGLWQEMVKAKKFPAKYLKPLNLTVSDVI